MWKALLAVLDTIFICIVAASTVEEMRCAGMYETYHRWRRSVAYSAVGVEKRGNPNNISAQITTNVAAVAQAVLAERERGAWCQEHQRLTDKTSIECTSTQTSASSSPYPKYLPGPNAEQRGYTRWRHHYLPIPRRVNHDPIAPSNCFGRHHGEPILPLNAADHVLDH